jgi:polysaccharide chain length determinant protein (PEP-CTERM system associated)
VHDVWSTLRRELLAAWSHRWLAVMLAWVVCLGGWCAVFTIPNQYEANARLFVEADAVLTPLLRGIAVDSGLSAQLESLERTLLSRPNLEKLISTTDLDLAVNGPSDLESLVQRLADDIRIVPQTHSLFTITYRNSNPKLAYDVVRAVLTLFVESKTGINRSEVENASTFIQQQLQEYENKLRDAEKRRAEFRAKYLDLLPGEGDTASGLDQTRTQVRQLQGDLQDAVAHRDMLNKELEKTPAMLIAEMPAGIGTGGNTESGPDASRLRDAEQKLVELRLRFTPQHPDVKAAEALVAEIKIADISAGSGASGAKAAAAARNRSVPNPTYQQFKVTLLDVDGQVASLERRLKETTAERDRLELIARGAPSLQAEFTNLNRDYDVIRKNYEELLGRRESMRIDAAAETSADKVKLEVVDPPQIPQNPVAPKRALLLSGVLIAGLGSGLGLALLLVQLDRSFRDIDDLRILGFPVVGGISLLTTTDRRGVFVTGASVALSVVLLVCVYCGLVLHITQITARI